MTTFPVLDEATLVALRSSHSHRFPQTGKLRPPAIGGSGTVEIQIVLGNPTGACRMPNGSVVSDVWRSFVRSALARAPEPDGFAEQLSRDSLLFPDPSTINSIFETWPALATVCASLVADKVKNKMALVVPSPAEEPPGPILEALASRPRAVWRWVRPTRADSFAIIIEPPGLAEWEIFSDEVKKPGSDNWRLACDLNASCVPLACSADGNETTLEQLVLRWPGVGIRICNEVAGLGGAGAEAELGE